MYEILNIKSNQYYSFSRSLKIFYIFGLFIGLGCQHYLIIDFNC